jgi:hypothetical protein
MAQPPVEVNVLIDDSHPTVVQDLQRTGLHVAQVLLTIGVVSGSVDADLLDELRQVPGVIAVEPSRKIEIARGTGPPIPRSAYSGP